MTFLRLGEVTALEAPCFDDRRLSSLTNAIKCDHYCRELGLARFLTNSHRKWDTFSPGATSGNVYVNRQRCRGAARLHGTGAPFHLQLIAAVSFSSRKEIQSTADFFFFFILLNGSVHNSS